LAVKRVLKKSGAQPGSAEVGVVVIFGVAGGSVGAVGATVSVTVSPVVTSDVVTGPGDGGSAELLFVEPIANAPMATTAPAPKTADASLICFEFTFDHPIRSLVGAQPAGRVEQFQRSRLATL
jgi:hypothetical protein